ncbi:MAG: hypothetical protein DDT27_01440 [Dehalococcoidia bacterium]|nr:hypothetical protein [Chloroflexota bacterium]MBT9162875.1 hypothetical protein [Chloroflexota bacterium]
MSAPSKARVVQLVKIQSEERLATTSELNLAPSPVMGCREARGMGYWAATQVKGLSPEITIVSVADVVHLCGRQNSHSRYWQGYASPTGSETVARYQGDDMGTREAQGVPRYIGVCNTKPIDSKVLQMTLWESDQLIVPWKQGNACGGKGLTGELLEQGHFLQTQSWSKEVNKTASVTYVREVLLKSRVRENLKHGSVRGLIVAPEENFQRRWL